MKKVILLLSVVVSCVFGGTMSNEINYIYLPKTECVKSSNNDKNFVLDLVNTGRIDDGITISHLERIVNTIGVMNIFYVVDYYENKVDHITFFDNYEYCNSVYNKVKKIT